jgi:hypothetical protein
MYFLLKPSTMSGELQCPIYGLKLPRIPRYRYEYSSTGNSTQRHDTDSTNAALQLLQNANPGAAGALGRVSPANLCRAFSAAAAKQEQGQDQKRQQQHEPRSPQQQQYMPNADIDSLIYEGERAILATWLGAMGCAKRPIVSQSGVAY